MSHSKTIARYALECGAIRFNPEKPFTWASGYKMPIYNDNRLLLGSSECRSLIAETFAKFSESFADDLDIIAGTATAGIPHATTLADRLKKPLIYVRASSKNHGMGNQIEGPLEPGQNVLVIEDLISTGGSAVRAIDAIRKSGGIVNHCFCIFTYGFSEAQRLLDEANCRFKSILTFPDLLEEAESMKMLANDQIQSLQAWYQDPFSWAENKKL